LRLNAAGKDDHSIMPGRNGASETLQYFCNISVTFD